MVIHMYLRKNELAITVPQAPTFKSCFETKIHLKQNNFNFGTTIYLKSRPSA